jgi:pimeloyl-ACP methyl ester carboxylesterase
MECPAPSASIARGGNAHDLVVGAGVELAATLTLPSRSAPHAAIIPLHPASERSRDQLLFRHLAEVLPPRGIAVLGYDRRGDDVPFEEQIVDANAAVDVLRARSDIDPSRIGLWGFSQGAWIAPMVAAGSDRIAFLVLLASTGVSPATQMRYGTVKHARQAGYGDDVAGRILELRGRFEEFQRGRLPRDAVQRSIDEAANEPWFEHAYVRSELPVEPGFWPDMDFDPAAVFAQVRVPTLLFYGADDEWQPIDASIAAWKRAAASAGNADLTIVRLAGTGHAPTLGGHDGRDEISPEYERSLLAWLDARVGSRR